MYVGIIVDSYNYSCFGYVNGKLYLGNGHHMLIMQGLLGSGMTWDELLTAKQTWGWFTSELLAPTIRFRLTTDAASIDRSLTSAVSDAITRLTGKPAEWDGSTWQSNQDYAPAFLPSYQMHADKGKILANILEYDPSTNTKRSLTGTPTKTGAVYDQATIEGVWEESDDLSYDWSYISFIYFPSTDEFLISGANKGHDEVIEEHQPDWGQLLNNNAIFGVIWRSALRNYVVQLNYSDHMRWAEGIEQELWISDDEVGKSRAIEYAETWLRAHLPPSEHGKIQVKANRNAIFEPDEVQGVLDTGYGVAFMVLQSGDVIYGETHELIMSQFFPGNWWDHLEEVIGFGWLYQDDGIRIDFDSDTGRTVTDRMSEELKDDITDKIRYELNMHSIYRTSALTIPRVCWLIDADGEVQMTNAHPMSSHAELGWVGNEIMAGDFHIYDDSDGGKFATHRLLLSDEDSDIMDGAVERVEETFRRMFNDEISVRTFVDARTNDQDPALGHAEAASWTPHKHGPFDPRWQEEPAVFPLIPEREPPNPVPGSYQVGNWTISEMNSGEYDRHDAIFIDRQNQVIYINYDGHHQPLFDELAGEAIYSVPGYSQVAGHWRREPSRDEPFGSGWGWHHGEPTDVEKQLLKDALKRHYQVDKLKQTWVGEEDYDHEVVGKVIWLDEVTKDFMRPCPWQAAYDPIEGVLMATTDMNITLPGTSQAQGFYTKVERTSGPQRDFVRTAMQQEVDNFYTVRKGETWRRWVYDKEAKVSIGLDLTHSDLIEKHYSSEIAEAYENRWEDYFNVFVTGGYITDDGIVHVIRSTGEAEFDAPEVALAVFRQAKADGIYVTGEVAYRDDTLDSRPVRRFDVA